MKREHHDTGHERAQQPAQPDIASVRGTSLEKLFSAHDMEVMDKAASDPKYLEEVEYDRLTKLSLKALSGPVKVLDAITGDKGLDDD